MTANGALEGRNLDFDLVAALTSFLEAQQDYAEAERTGELNRSHAAAIDKAAVALGQAVENRALQSLRDTRRQEIQG